MKTKRICIGILLILALMAGLCACSPGGSSGGGNSLDLDYEDNGVAVQEEETTKSASWFSQAFSFGKKEEKSDDGQNVAQGKDASTSDTSGNNFQGGSDYASDQKEGTNGSSQSSGSQTQGSAAQANQPSGSSRPPANSGSGSNGGSGGSSSNNTSGNSQQQGSQTQGGSGSGQGQNTPASNNTVTISIRCDTAVNNGMHLESKWTGIVPASGSILPTTTVEIEGGETVFDILAYVCSKYKIHMSYRGGTGSGCYVDGINNLYEFDGGRWSGWMYCVNSWYPNYGCGVYYVKAGDVIEWNYTCDLGLDLDGSWWEGAQEWKDTHD